MKKKVHILEEKVDFILLSENSLMSAENEALSTFSTLDVLSSIIILSFVFSMLPVKFFFVIFANFEHTTNHLLVQNWDKVVAALDQNPVWSYVWLNILVHQ